MLTDVWCSTVLLMPGSNYNFQMDFWNSFQVIFARLISIFFPAQTRGRLNPAHLKTCEHKWERQKVHLWLQELEKKKGILPNHRLQFKHSALHIWHMRLKIKSRSRVGQLSFRLGLISCVEQLDPAAVLKNICPVALTNSLTWNSLFKEMGQTCSKPGEIKSCLLWWILRWFEGEKMKIYH